MDAILPLLATGIACFSFGFLAAAVFMSARSDELLLTDEYLVERVRRLEGELEHVPARGSDGRFVRRAV